MYKVKSPFMSRKGQFSEEQDLCVGVSVDALKSTGDDSFSLKIGKSEKIYSRNAKELLQFIEDKKSWWISKKSGKEVGIIPVKEFT